MGSGVGEEVKEVVSGGSDEVVEVGGSEVEVVDVVEVVEVVEVVVSEVVVVVEVDVVVVDVLVGEVVVVGVVEVVDVDIVDDCEEVDVGVVEVVGGDEEGRSVEDITEVEDGRKSVEEDESEEESDGDGEEEDTTGSEVGADDDDIESRRAGPQPSPSLHRPPPYFITSHSPIPASYVPFLVTVTPLILPVQGFLQRIVPIPK